MIASVESLHLLPASASAVSVAPLDERLSGRPEDGGIDVVVTLSDTFSRTAGDVVANFSSRAGGAKALSLSRSPHIPQSPACLFTSKARTRASQKAG